MRRAGFLTLAAALIAAALDPPAQAATETRAVPAFHAIRVTGVAQVGFTQAATQSITATASPALLKRLRLTVSDGTLTIGLKSGTIFGNDGKLHLAITAPKLDRFDVAGVANATVRGLTGDHFALSLSGTGSFDLQGAVDHAAITVSGAGSIDARHLITRDLTLDISGAGSVRAYASRLARVSVSGVGSAKIYGHPAQRSVSRTGVGSVRFD